MIKYHHFMVHYKIFVERLQLVQKWLAVGHHQSVKELHEEEGAMAFTRVMKMPFIHWELMSEYDDLTS